MALYGKHGNLKGWLVILTKEQLTAMGLTEEQADKVLAAQKTAIGGNFVTKDRFNEVNIELKQVKDTINERDGQLQTLNTSTGNVDALKKQIAELQTSDKANDEAHAAELKQLRFDTGLNAALMGAKAKNPETVKPLLKAFLEKAELDGDGSIKRLGDEIKKLADGNDTKFLFDAARQQKPGFKGFVPGEKKDGQTTPLTFEEAVRSHYEGQIN